MLLIQVWIQGYLEQGTITCKQPEIPLPSVCANEKSVDLCAPPGYSYKWEENQPNAVPPFDQQCLKVNDPKAGDVYKVTLTSPSGGCPVVSEIKLKGSDFLIHDTTVCKGAPKFPLTLTPLSKGNFEFKWEPATNLSCSDCQSPVFDPQSSQTYTVTMIDKDVTNCNRVREVKINVNKGDSVSTKNVKICNGETATLSATGADTYIWEPGSLSGTSVQVQPDKTTTYTVTGASANGCLSSPKAVATVTVMNKPIVETTNTTICKESKAELKATVTGGITNGIWTGGAGQFIPDRTSLNPVYIPTATEESAGAVTLTFEAGDSSTCGKVTKQLTVTILAPQKLDAGTDQIICETDSIRLTADLKGSTSTPVWTGGTGIFSPNNNSTEVIYKPSKTEIANGKATLILNARGTDICKVIPDTMSISIRKKTIVKIAEPKNICEGEIIHLNGTISGGATTGEWTKGEGTYSKNSRDLKADYQPSDSEIKAGKVTLHLIADTGGCAVDSAIITYLIFPKPIVSFSADKEKGCDPHCVNFINATVSTKIEKWEWNFGNGKTTSAQVPPQICYSPGIYTVTLKAVSDKNCASVHVKNNFIESYKRPVAAFNANPDPASTMDPGIHFFDQSSTKIKSWFWNFGDELSGTSNLQNPFYAYQSKIPDSYIVKLTVTNQDGCLDSIEHTIDIKPYFTFYIPNAFTPNKDEINDLFAGKGNGIADYHLLVFDRWGNLIFESTALDKGWDGTFKGEEVAQDVFIWKVNVKDFFGKSHQYLGTVHLLR